MNFGRIEGPWQALSDLRWQAYEIRCGDTQAIEHDGRALAPVLHDAEGKPIGWTATAAASGLPRHNVLGIATHGLFEDARALRALFGQRARTLDETFDGLAELVDEHLGGAKLRALFEG